MIDVLNLHKRFESVAAVAGVSFTAADGAITGVLGENGAGKTTTLSMIAGIVAPDAGVARIDGLADGAIEVRRRVGALLDHHGLYPRLTARENIAYFGALHGLSGAALEQRVAHVIGVLGLGAIANRRVQPFSHGERLKVALGRVIVHAPQNLILDEVTNGLDVTTVRSLRGLLRQWRDDGRCILFSSHVLEEVEALCNHIVVVSRGTVVAQGTTTAICEQAGCRTLEDAFVELTSRAGEASCLSA